MIECIEIPSLEAFELYTFLDGHGLVTEGMKADMTSVTTIAAVGTFYAWVREDEPMAMMVELQSREPGVMDIILVPVDRELGKTYRVEVAELAKELRQRWFEDHRRVQTSAPASRVNMQRTLKALGFIEETRHGMGIRGLVQLAGTEPEAMLIFGLLESDPVRTYEGKLVETGG